MYFHFFFVPAKCLIHLPPSNTKLVLVRNPRKLENFEPYSNSRNATYYFLNLSCYFSLLSLLWHSVLPCFLQMFVIFIFTIYEFCHYPTHSAHCACTTCRHRVATCHQVKQGDNETHEHGVMQLNFTFVH